MVLMVLRFSRIFLFVSLFVTFLVYGFGWCFAEELALSEFPEESVFFDFKPISNLASGDGVFEVEMFYDLEEGGASGTPGTPESYLRVRPKASHGLVYIYNHGAREWVLGSGSWTKMPALQKKLKLKIIPKDFSKTGIQLEVLGRKVFETPAHTVWGSKIYKGYFDNLKYTSIYGGAVYDGAAGNNSEFRQPMVSKVNKLREMIKLLSEKIQNRNS